VWGINGGKVVSMSLDTCHNLSIVREKRFSIVVLGYLKFSEEEVKLKVVLYPYYRRRNDDLKIVEETAIPSCFQVAMKRIITGFKW
jgi:hypothetical protein